MNAEVGGKNTRGPKVDWGEEGSRLRLTFERYQVPLLLASHAPKSDPRLVTAIPDNLAIVGEIR